MLLHERLFSNEPEYLPILGACKPLRSPVSSRSLTFSDLACEPLTEEVSYQTSYWAILRFIEGTVTKCCKQLVFGMLQQESELSFFGLNKVFET
jgi:hypothetical protein